MHSPGEPDILLINGSCRPGGNTDRLLDELAASLAAAGAGCLRHDLRDLAIADCDGCDRCLDGPGCAIDDGMAALYSAIERARVLVFATPLYWCEVTGRMKTFIDRLYLYHQPRHAAGIAGKAVLVVAPFAAERVFHETEVVVSFFNRLFHSLGLRVLDMCFFPGLRESTAAASSPAALERIRGLGPRLARELAGTPAAAATR